MDIEESQEKRRRTMTSKGEAYTRSIRKRCENILPEEISEVKDINQYTATRKRNSES